MNGSTRHIRWLSALLILGGLLLVVGAAVRDGGAMIGTLLTSVDELNLSDETESRAGGLVLPQRVVVAEAAPGSTADTEPGSEGAAGATSPSTTPSMIPTPRAPEPTSTAQPAVASTLTPSATAVPVMPPPSATAPAVPGVMAWEPPPVTDRLPPEMPRRLVIARIGVDAPVVHVPLAQQTWDLSLIEKEIAYLGSTAQPGEGSNVVLAGHVTLLRGGPGPFLLLESLQEGDPLVVHTDSRIHTYLVDSMRVVAPTDVSVVHATETSTLTLITCTTWDAGSRSYLERVVVTAHEVETSP